MEEEGNFPPLSFFLSLDLPRSSVVRDEKSRICTLGLVVRGGMWGGRIGDREMELTGTHPPSELRALAAAHRRRSSEGTQ